MATEQAKELRYYFCPTHYERVEQGFWKRFHPGYRFNFYSSFAKNLCNFTGCKEIAYHECIGIQVPDTAPIKEIKSKVKQEIFNSAKPLLEGGAAIDRLSVFIKSKVLPLKSFMADYLIRDYARRILESLNIEELQSLSNNDINKILIELNLYPKDDN